MPLSTTPSTGGDRRRRSVVAAAVLGLVATSLALGFAAAPHAQAVPSTTLVITEVYGGGGNSGANLNADFVELYNTTNAPISLAGKSLQYRSATGSTIAGVAPLSAEIPAKSTFVVRTSAPSSTTGASFSFDIDASGIGIAGTAGTVFLVDGTAAITPSPGIGSQTSVTGVIDLVGVNSNTFEGLTAPAMSVTRSVSRLAPIYPDTDNNAADFSQSAISGQTPSFCDCIAPAFKITEVHTDGGTGGAYTHDFVEIYNPSTSALPQAGLSLQYRAPGATGPATVIATLTGSMAGTSYDLVQLGAGGAGTAPVPSAEYTNAAVDLSTAGGTLLLVKGTAPLDPGTGAFAKNQYVSDLVGWGNANVYETTAAGVADLSSARTLTRAPGAVDTDVNLDDFSADVPNPNGAPTIPVRTIAEIQGTGNTTPMPNALVETSGVVTGSYTNANGGLKGYFIQTPGPDTPDAADGLFVYTGSLNPAPTPPAVGNAVTVRGRISEFAGMTEMTQSFLAGSFVDNGPAPVAIVPKSVLPGTQCALPGTGCPTGTDLAAARELAEGELFLPTQDFTVSDSYDGSPWSQSGTNGFAMAGEIGLAANDTMPLIAPTEVHSPTTDPAGIAARKAYNDAHMITLDDGADIDFTSSAFEDIENFPWFTKTNTVRMGAAATFVKPMVFEYRNDLWRLQPQTRVIGDGRAFVEFEQDRPAAPDDVLGATGDLTIATFNMLNYFNTVGEDWAAARPATRSCSYYTDRGVPSPAKRITNDTCEEDAVDPLTGLPVVLPGPRGAATQVSFKRQEDKELAAINTMDADVVSLEEVENSTKIGDADRDDAIIRLVTQLNADYATTFPAAPAPRWAYVPSPRLEAQPTLQEQDAIRSAFIYNPSKVERVGASRILVNSAPFRNAREPLAQAFKPLGGGRADAFAVIVNHFKSKGGPTAPATVNGDNVDKGDGAGFYNGDRKRQAAALVAFANQFAADMNIAPVFMTGDYNAYSQEDPIQVIRDGGFTDLHPDNGETSYSFGGLAGSLDHVFVNAAAEDMVVDEDVWAINANESVYYEYSRFNANLTDLYDVNPFRSSDHNPEIIGIDVGAITPDPAVDTVQILATNDFHGRILDNPGDGSAGAASLAGAVKQLEGQNPNTVFAAAGDLIGASTFESFIAKDKPTIDALNEAGLDVSAAGNHEFDAGYADLVDRVMAPYDATTNPYGGAEWQYIAANVELNGTSLLPETWCETLPNGKTVGFVGAVTEDLPALVAGSGIQGITVTDIVDSVNTFANALKMPNGCGVDGPADLVVELVHEGAATTAYSSVTDNSTFGQIVAGANANIDAIVSGHTHLAYNHKVPVAAWAGRDVTSRPVVSAGQYGANLNRLQFEFDTIDGDLVNVRQTVLALKDYDADPATQDIVDDAVAFANVQGNVVLGDIEGPFVRARQLDPVTTNPIENRGGESTLGNQIAEIQRWKTDADLGLMNPGGLRADLVGTLSGNTRTVNYRQAADAQPFANTLVTMDLTGAQLKTILEQQWQRDPDGNIPTRPFQRLGTSKGFTSTYDPTRAEGDRVTGMWLDGVRITPTQTLRVAATSFLASGTGDNFFGFGAATNKQDTGKTDLQAVVDYLDALTAPLEVGYEQHQVGVHLTGVVPQAYATGDTLTMAVSSLAMTGADDARDTQVELFYGATSLGVATVNNALRNVPDDEVGTATFSVVLPAGLTNGTTRLTLRGTTTGTEVPIIIPTTDGRTVTTVSGTDQSIAVGESGTVPVTVLPATATGTVTLNDGAVEIGSTTLTNGAGDITVPAGSLAVGPHTLTLVYSGDTVHGTSEATVQVTITKQAVSLTATPDPASVVLGTGTSQIVVTASSALGTPSGDVSVTVAGTTYPGTLVAGTVRVTVGPFATLGAQQVSVAYLGDATHATATATTQVTVVGAPQTGSSVTAPALTVTYGQSATLNVTVLPATASGTVTVREGATVIGTGTVTAGAASVTLPARSLTVGPHTLTLSYSGDASTAASQGLVSVTVVKASPVITATPTPASIETGTATAAIAVTVSAAGVSPTGTVTASVGGSVVDTKPLVNGAASLIVGPFSTPGSRTVTIAYSGDGTTAAGTTTTVVAVTAPGSPTDPVVTTTTATAQPMVYGTDGSVQVSVSSAKPTSGVVQLLDGTTVLGTGTVAADGTVAIVVPGTALPAGTYTLSVAYLGDAQNNPSQGSVQLVVTKATAAGEVVVTPTRVVVGQGRARVRADVTAPGYTPTGAVELRVDGDVVRTATLRNGSVAVTLPVFRSVGRVRVAVVYLGDANTVGKRVGVSTVRVTKARPRLRVQTSPNRVIVRRTKVTLDVSVATPGQVVRGKVRVSIRGRSWTATLRGQSASVTLPAFATTGRKTVTVRYLGSDLTKAVKLTRKVRVTGRR